MDEAGAKPKPTLEDLARERFPDLSEAELKLLSAAPKGLVAHCGDPALDPEEPLNNPRHSETWGKERDIRAGLIRWLCVDPEARSRIDPLGIRVLSAKIEGELDLSFVAVPFPLVFRSCKFGDPLRLQLSELPRLDLSGSAFGAVSLNGAQIRGSVLLRDASGAGGEVRLYGATIGSNLECDGASFKNANGIALNVEQANIDEVFSLADASATGEVRLQLAAIGGALVCDGATFKNASGYAINAELATIDGVVILRNGFSAEGEVRLHGATIGSNLECDGASFKNANGIALNAEGAKVQGSVYLRNRFSAEGEVRLFRVSVGGDIGCNNGSFKSTKLSALNASLAKVAGPVLLTQGFNAVGWVRFEGASIAGDLNLADANFEATTLDLRRASAVALRSEPKSWPKAGSLSLDGLSYGRLAEAPIDSNHRLNWLRLQPSRTVGNNFSPQPYRHLAQVLREQGHEAAARDVLIGLEDDRRKYGDLTRAQRLWAWVTCWTMAYGYRPFRALWFIGFFVILGFLVFGSGYQSGQLVPSDKDAYDKFQAGHLPGSYESFCALVYSFDTFVPIIDLGQRRRWKPIDSDAEALAPVRQNEDNDLVCAICDPMALTQYHQSFPAWFIRFFWWLDMVFGWFFTGLFFAGISGLVRRD